MGIVFTNHNIDLLSVEFDEITKNCNYTFSVDGETAIFTARISIIRNIKGIKYSEELDKFIMSIMPLQPKVSKILGRVPFLDKEFLDVAMTLNPKAKMCPGKNIEKRIVREAFADMLPESVAWRQKEQFSDGVGYSWIDTLKEITTAAVSDEQMENAAGRFPINTPQNKEEYYYRSIFEEHFPSESAARSVPSVPSVACSTAEALAWDIAFKNLNEPSGRAVKGIHEEAYT